MNKQSDLSLKEDGVIIRRYINETSNKKEIEFLIDVLAIATSLSSERIDNKYKRKLKELIQEYNEEIEK